MARIKFEPDNISQEMMDIFADSVDEFLTEQKRITVFPKELTSENKSTYKEARKRVMKMIEKLREGDKSLFKDPDDWNSID